LVSKANSVAFRYTLGPFLFTLLSPLSLGNNAFHGDIPNEYLEDLVVVRKLDFSNNTFAGFARDGSSGQEGTKKLKELNLSNNNFAGEVRTRRDVRVGKSFD
jgi:hypothetical protein